MRDYTRHLFCCGAALVVCAHAQSADIALTSGVCDQIPVPVEIDKPVVVVDVDTTELFDSNRPEQWARAADFISVLLVESLAPEMTLHEDAVDPERSAVFSTPLSLRDR